MPTQTSSPAQTDPAVTGGAGVVDWAPSDQVFHDAAKTFRVMAAPLRLKIISTLCQGEKNVGELLQSIDTTQPNMSQHLHTLHRAGILGRRRDGVQIYYRIVNESVVGMCRAMCTQLAIDAHDE